MFLSPPVLQLKLITYQEWLDLLLKINDAIFTNMEELEEAVNHRLRMINNLMLAHASVSEAEANARAETRIKKYRKDIQTLIGIIQKAYLQNDWNISDQIFETISASDVLGKCLPDESSLKKTSSRRRGGGAAIQVSIV